MARWLYDSKGKPIAFIVNDNVFSRAGRYVGRLDGNEVWHGRYKGEIIKDDRFLHKKDKGSVIRGRSGVPGHPGIPGRPGNKGSTPLPSGYKDVDLED